MNEQCREETCCDAVDGLSGVVVADPGTTFDDSGSSEGGDGEDPNCKVPTVSLTVDKSIVKCGGHYVLSWSTQDVGPSGTVTITDLGAVTRDSAGTHTFTFKDAVNSSIVYILTATNSCGTAEATVTVTLDTDVGLYIAFEPGNPPCMGIGPFFLDVSTWGVTGKDSTVVVSASPDVAGFPRNIVPNTGEKIYFSEAPTADTVFTLTVTTPCGTYTDDVEVANRIGPVTVQYLTATYTGCNTYTLAWDGKVCFPPAQITIQGPQPGSDAVCGASVTYDLPGSVNIDAKDYAECFTEGTGGCYTATYAYTVSTTGGEAYQGGLQVWAYPELDYFRQQTTEATTITVPCPETGVGYVQLDLEAAAWFAEYFRVTNTNGNLVIGDFPATEFFGTAYYVAKFSVYLSPSDGVVTTDESGIVTHVVTLMVEPVVAADTQCATKSCNSPLYVTVIFTGTPAACTTCTAATVLPPAGELSYDFSGVINDPAVVPMLQWQDATAIHFLAPGGTITKWDRILHLKAAPNVCIYDEGFDGVYPPGEANVVVFEGSTAEYDHVVDVTLMFYEYNAGLTDCYWRLRVGPNPIGTERCVYYIKKGMEPFSATVPYLKHLPWDAAIDPDYFPDEIYILPIVT